MRLLSAVGLALGALAPAAFAADLIASDPYVVAVPPGTDISAAYMVLRNAGSEDVAVVAAESNAARFAELHAHELVDGVARMRRIGRIPIAAGAEAELAPGSMHIMLIGLAHDLEAGQEVAIDLLLEDGSRISVPARVQPAAAVRHSSH